MNPKIDIFVNCKYECSTNMSKTLKEAKEKFLKAYQVDAFDPKTVKCCFDKTRN